MESKEKFTKGPWHHDDRLKWGVLDDAGNVIADCDCLGEGEEEQANADLIAAAPEMFDLLWQISGALEGCKYEDAISVDLEHKINAIIAKALGEEPKS